MTNKPPLIIWPIDALGPKLESQSSTIKVISPLVRILGAQVEPVYVLSWAQASLGPFRFDADLDFFFKQAQERLREWAKGISQSWILKPKILVSDSRTQRGAVDALCEHALGSGGNLIVTRTHARKGVPRWFLGSFAETLLLRSSIPILTLGPTLNSLRSRRPILFPTDFGKQSDLILPEVARLASALQVPLKMFHAEETIPRGAIESGLYPVLEEFKTSLRLAPVPRKKAVRLRKKADKYLRIAQTIGAKADITFDREYGAVFDRLFKFKRKVNPSLIAMAAQSGPFRATLTGSTARQVVRAADCPVWILHKTKEQSKAYERKTVA